MAKPSLELENSHLFLDHLMASYLSSPSPPGRKKSMPHKKHLHQAQKKPMEALILHSFAPLFQMPV
ncbi:hypothetical protein HNQ65_002038 [Prosthecobacter vanneervenii]|uniref:Uncharacterized protein n=1 Tax=Prosthecobacter vanneervenii TaxID=48466 RepID=A0A7W7YA74_9BACT|nr:hypothetical protein [Prosthecobacter vanneervenii]